MTDKQKELALALDNVESQLNRAEPDYRSSDYSIATLHEAVRDLMFALGEYGGLERTRDSLGHWRGWRVKTDDSE